MEPKRFRPRLRLVRGGLTTKSEQPEKIVYDSEGFDIPQAPEAFGPFTRLGLADRFPSLHDNRMLQLQILAKVALLVALLYFIWR